MPHVHQLVPIREALGEHWIYWCRDCGLICERFGTKVYEMIPEYSKERLLKEGRRTEEYRFLPLKPEKRSENRLGRGLKDIISPVSSVVRKMIKNGKP